MHERSELQFSPETKESRHVVRAFIVQAKTLDRIKQEFVHMTDSRDLFLTKVVLAEKSAESEKNAGQAMPIGGKVEKTDTNSEQAMLREMLEETHLRPIEVTALDTGFDFTLKTSKGNIGIHQEFFVV